MEYAPAILLSALAMTLIVGGRYLLSSGFFAWLTNRVRPGQYDRLKPQMKREVRWSLLSAAIYGIPAGIVAWGWQNAGWTKIYTDPAQYPLWYLPLSERRPVMARSIEADTAGETATGASLADALAPSSSTEAAPKIRKPDIRAAEPVPKAKVQAIITPV